MMVGMSMDRDHHRRVSSTSLSGRVTSGTRSRAMRREHVQFGGVAEDNGTFPIAVTRSPTADQIGKVLIWQHVVAKRA